MMTQHPAALLDANVLIPTEPRDTLLHAAEAGLWRVYWTEQLLAETERNLVGEILRGDEASRKIRAGRLLAEMRYSFPNALIGGYEYAIPLMTNAPEDRHITAAAYHAGVPLIVTLNLRHFPPAALAPFGLQAVHPDDFLLALFAASPDVFVAIVQEQAEGRTRPRQSVADVLDTVTHLAPRFAAAMRQRLQPL